MTITDRPPASAVSDEAAPARGFRPGSRRRARIAGGIAIAAVAVAGNVLLYSSLEDSTEVVQFVDNVAAGELISSTDVRIVEVDGDVTSANLVPADEIGSIVNRYARTFIPSGSLASVFVVQSDPLVGPGTAVVAVTPSGDLIPQGLTERSRVQLVLGGEATTLVEARVVAVERDESTGASSMSVEVSVTDAPAVAAAEDLHVVLLDPGIDPATEGSG
jgi:HAMP domain-containing protein